MTAFDFRGLVARFANATNLVVARELPPTYDGGLALTGGWETFTIGQAFIWPDRPTALDMATGGARLRGSVKVAVQAETPIGTGYDAPARGDVFAWQGHTYRVVDFEDWRPSSGLLIITAVRQDVDERTVSAWVAAEGGEA